MQREKSNIIIIASAIILCLVIGFLVGNRIYKSDQEAVASVNGVKITKEQLYNEMLKSNGEQTLDILISDQLIQIETAKQNIVVTDEEVQAELQNYYDYYGGEEAFNEALAGSGYTLDEVKKQIENELSVRKILEPQITITDEELKSYFETNKAQFAQDEQEPDFEESKDKVREALLQEKLQTQYDTWLQSLYDQYTVENYLAG